MMELEINTDVNSLKRERTLFFTNDVSQDSIGALTKQIVDINDADRQLKRIYKAYGLKYKPQPIKIYIDSFGGCVYSVLGLIGVMDSSKTPIHTYVTGTAQSAGFMMLIAGHKRHAHRLSTVMYHALSTVSYGQIEQVEEDYVESKRLQKLLEREVIARTNLKKSDLKTIKKSKKDWFVGPDDAKSLGIIDKIV